MNELDEISAELFEEIIPYSSAFNTGHSGGEEL